MLVKAPPFPRARARGLIEAPSLPVSGAFQLLFPRARARGLIEARVVAWLAPGRYYFRERALAASLKPIWRNQTTAEMPDFRERALAASLKHQGRLRGSRIATVFPRARARGLIEARFNRTMISRITIFPRARARGLIEASSASWSISS